MDSRVAIGAARTNHSGQLLTRLLGPSHGPFFLIESGERTTDCRARSDPVEKTLYLHQSNCFRKNGGDDGTRTCDLCRDNLNYRRVFSG